MDMLLSRVTIPFWFSVLVEVGLFRTTAEREKNWHRPTFIVTIVSTGFILIYDMKLRHGLALGSNSTGELTTILFPKFVQWNTSIMDHHTGLYCGEQISLDSLKLITIIS